MKTLNPMRCPQEVRPVSAEDEEDDEVAFSDDEQASNSAQTKS